MTLGFYFALGLTVGLLIGGFIGLLIGAMCCAAGKEKRND